MFCTLECDHRSLQTIGLPSRIAITPAASMARKAVEKFVVAKILRALVAIGLACIADSRSVKEREAQRIVARPIGAGLRAGENCDAEFAALIREIEPA